MAARTPEIFDHALRRQRLQRAQAHPHYTDFLLRRGAADVDDRLRDITRHFDHALFITPVPVRDFAMPVLQQKVRQIDYISLIDNLDFDEENPGLAATRYDLIINLGCLHVVNDLPGVLYQFRAALKPDGFFLANFFGGETLYELRQAFIQAESEYENTVSPHIHPFGELRELGTLLQRAGFALPVADCERLCVRYDNPLALLHDLQYMGESNILLARRRAPLRRDILHRAMQIYTESFADMDGKIPARFDLITLSGWMPHHSQQKPLRPGSATTRLADALGSHEEKL